MVLSDVPARSTSARSGAELLGRHLDAVLFAIVDEARSSGMGFFARIDSRIARRRIIPRVLCDLHGFDERWGDSVGGHHDTEHEEENGHDYDHADVGRTVPSDALEAIVQSREEADILERIQVQGVSDELAAVCAHRHAAVLVPPLVGWKQ